MFALLDRSRTVAPPGYCRWLVPPAALAVHLSIGQSYALSVFSIPLSRGLGIDHTAAGDWEQSSTIWMFNLAFCCLGLSAAVFGTWVERSGPRRTMVASASCFAGGFLVSALGVHLHSLSLLLLGYGVLGGIGLGLGYIAPVSTLLKWFPDRPGMATGLAIMGFGGGAMLGSPLAMLLMEHFASSTSNGVAATFLALGAIYFAMMLFGAAIVRVPPPNFAPGASVRDLRPAMTAPPDGSTAREAIRTRSFWLVWTVLFCNVTAGIGILGQASPMIQEMFSTSSGAAAGFVGLLSLSNLVGRFLWSSLSDRLGRKRTYAVYLSLGMGLYALLPGAASIGSQWLFVAASCVILSMYGGCFATVPAYLRDLFGTREVGAIHGRLLTAWSLAAIVGPSAMAYVRDHEIARGVAKAEVYSGTIYGLVALLGVGLLANAFVRPRAVARPASDRAVSSVGDVPIVVSARIPWMTLFLWWSAVLVPLAWGVAQVVSKAMVLFA